MGGACITDLLGYPYTRGMVDKRSCSLRTLGSSQLETGSRYALCNPRYLPYPCSTHDTECNADGCWICSDDGVCRCCAGYPPGQFGRLRGSGTVNLNPIFIISGCVSQITPEYQCGRTNAHTTFDAVDGGAVRVQADVDRDVLLFKVPLARQKLPIRYWHGLGRCGGQSHQSGQRRDTDRAKHGQDFLPKAPHVGPKRIA